MDSGITRHVCKDKSLFKSIEVAPEGMIIYMENATNANVLGIGSVELMFTYGKKLTLTNIYYVP